MIRNVEKQKVVRYKPKELEVEKEKGTTLGMEKKEINYDNAPDDDSGTDFDLDEIEELTNQRTRKKGDTTLKR